MLMSHSGRVKDIRVFSPQKKIREFWNTKKVVELFESPPSFSELVCHAREKFDNEVEL